MKPPHNRADDRSGFFVAVEGIDGTGKSTLVRGVAGALEARGIKCAATREPTDGPHGKKIRALATSGRDKVSVDEETELFIADRREHLALTILPALDRGEVVITDRYYYSTMAYQGARGADVIEITRRHAEFAPEPEMLVMLELPVDRALDRIRVSRGSEPDHFEGRDYLAKVRAIFDTIAHSDLLRLDAKLEPTELVETVVDRIVSRLRRDA